MIFNNLSFSEIKKELNRLLVKNLGSINPSGRKFKDTEDWYSIERYFGMYNIRTMYTIRKTEPFKLEILITVIGLKLDDNAEEITNLKQLAKEIGLTFSERNLRPTVTDFDLKGEIDYDFSTKKMGKFKDLLDI